MTNIIEKKNLSVKEAAAWSGMSEAWFNRKRWTGDGPVYLKSDDGRGGRILYPLTELERFFSGRLRRSTSDSGPAANRTSGLSQQQGQRGEQ